VESHRLISVVFAEDGIAEGGRVQESEWESENSVTPERKSAHVGL
jgi:hypothetical protein